MIEINNCFLHLQNLGNLKIWIFLLSDNLSFFLSLFNNSNAQLWDVIAYALTNREVLESSRLFNFKNTFYLNPSKYVFHWENLQKYIGFIRPRLWINQRVFGKMLLISARIEFSILNSIFDKTTEKLFREFLSVHIEQIFLYVLTICSKTVF